MPIQSCNPADRGATFNAAAMELPIGNGHVLAEYRYTWDGISVWPACDGPLTLLHVRNTSSQVAYALCPGKKKGDLWVEIPAGTDTNIGAGQRNQLGLENASDIAGVGISATPDGSPSNLQAKGTNRST